MGAEIEEDVVSDRLDQILEDGSFLYLLFYEGCSQAQ